MALKPISTGKSLREILQAINENFEYVSSLGGGTGSSEYLPLSGGTLNDNASIRMKYGDSYQADYTYGGMDFKAVDETLQITANHISFGKTSGNQSLTLLPNLAAGVNQRVSFPGKSGTLAVTSDIPEAYSLPTASSSTLGGVKTTSTVTSTSGLTACPIIGGVPYYKDTNTTTFAASAITSGTLAAARLPSAGASLGGVKSGGDVTISNGVITVDRADKVKSLDTSTSYSYRVALLLDAAGKTNDELSKSAYLKFDARTNSLIENGVALANKYGTYKHDITFTTPLGDGWMTFVDNHATAYNDTTFREKYPSGFFNSVGVTTSWDAVLIGQIDVGYGEFYGVIAYNDGRVYPVMDAMSFTIVDDFVTN